VQFDIRSDEELPRIGKPLEDNPGGSVLPTNISKLLLADAVGSKTGFRGIL